VSTRGAEGVLLTGVYGSGKSSVAEEMAYLLEQQGEPYALLDLDYLSWAGTGAADRAAEFGLMLQNLAAVAANYRRAGIRLFVLAYFVRNSGETQAVRETLGLPLRVVRLTVQLPPALRRGGVALGGPADLRARAGHQRCAGVAVQRARGARGVGEVDRLVYASRVTLPGPQFHLQRAVRAGLGSGVPVTAPAPE